MARPDSENTLRETITVRGPFIRHNNAEQKLCNENPETSISFGRFSAFFEKRRPDPWMHTSIQQISNHYAIRMNETSIPLRREEYAMLPLVHPGYVLLQKMLDEDWSLSDVANQIGADRELLRDFLLGDADISPDLADKLEHGTGLSADYWIRVQVRHDAAEAGTPLPIEFVEPSPAT